MQGVAKPLSVRKGSPPKEGELRPAPGRPDKIRSTVAFAESYVLIARSVPAYTADGERQSCQHKRGRMRGTSGRAFYRPFRIT